MSAKVLSRVDSTLIARCEYYDDQRFEEMAYGSD